MITFKRIDCHGQLFLSLASIAFGASLYGIMGAALFYGFFIGSWQILSATIHLFISSSLKLVVWRSLQWIAIATVVSIIFFIRIYLKADATKFFYVVSILNVGYAILSYRELKIWEHRRLIQLR